MKTTTKAMRALADMHAKADDPDTATALRWAADDIDALVSAIGFIRDLNAEVAPDIAHLPAGELLTRHVARRIEELGLAPAPPPRPRPAYPNDHAQLLRAWADFELGVAPPPPIDYHKIAQELENLWSANRALNAALDIKVREVARIMLDQFQSAIDAQLGAAIPAGSDPAAGYNQAWELVRETIASASVRTQE